MLPFFKFGSPTTCTYCGEPANETDHVIAVSRQEGYDKRNNRITGFGPITFCCSECNDKLHIKLFDSFLARCEYIAKLYDEQGKRVEWSLKQIDELGYTLQTYIRHQRNRRLWYRARSDWFESRDFILGLSQLKFESSLDKAHPSFNEELYNYFYSAICFANIYKE